MLGSYVLPALAFGAMYFLHQDDLNVFLRNYLGVGAVYVVASRNTIGTQIATTGDEEYTKVAAYKPNNAFGSIVRSGVLATQPQFDAWAKREGF